MARPRERLPPFSISLVKSLPLPKDLTDSLMEALRLPSSESSPRQLAPGRTPLKRKPPDYAERAERYAMILQLLKSEPAKPLAGRRSPGFGGRKVSGCKGGESLRRAMPGPGAKRVGATENAAPKVGRSGEISDGSVGTSFQKIAGSVGMGPPRERGTEKQDSKSPPISHIDLTSFRRGGSDLRPRLTEKPQNVADPVMPALSRSGRKENGEEVKDAGRRTELWPKDKRVDERSLRLGSRHKEQRGRETLGQSAGVLRRFSNGQQAIHAEETRISSTGYTKAIEEVQVQGMSPGNKPP